MNRLKQPLIIAVIIIGISLNTAITNSNGNSYNCGFLFGTIVALINVLWDAEGE